MEQFFPISWIFSNFLKLVAEKGALKKSPMEAKRCRPFSSVHTLLVICVEPTSDEIIWRKETEARTVSSYWL